MPFNLLLFPLVGGYYLITHLERFRFLNHRLDSQTVLFNSTIVGIILLLISFLFCSTITWLFPGQVEYVKTNVFPIKESFFGTAVLSYFIGVAVSKVGNLFINEQKEIARAIDRIGNELELLFKFSCEKSEPILVTLKNDKVYIGWVELLPKPQPPESTYIRLVPLLSGYRDSKKSLHITTNYSQVYSDYIRQARITKIVDLQMNLVIQVSEIISATRFDAEMFEQFQAESI
jgi:small nuclear ribonucleoprotein (snRNP)-like protein